MNSRNQQPEPSGGERESASESAPRKLRLDLPAAHSAVRTASQTLREFGASGGLKGQELQVMLLVASELLGNAVDHGGGQAAMEEHELPEPMRMLLAMDLYPTRWEMRVADQGGGDPGEVEQHLKRGEIPDLEDERGRGLFLLEQMLDRLEVHRSQDGRGLEFLAERSHKRKR